MRATSAAGRKVNGFRARFARDVSAARDRLVASFHFSRLRRRRSAECRSPSVSFSLPLCLLALSYFDDPNLIGTHTHCLLTEQPACRRPITVAAVRRARVLGIRSAVRVIATTWTKVDDKLVSVGH